MPNGPLVAAMAPVKALSYPLSCIAGIKIDPIAEVAAAPEPDIVPKNIHATTHTSDNPPFI